MKIVVCVKPVKAGLVYPEGAGGEEYVLNPYDLYALENALELKKHVKCTVTCLCMGAQKAKPMLTKALAMGADDAVLLNDNAFIGSDTVATTYVLSKAVRNLGGADLVVCGDRSIDGETGQVVFGLGEQLGYVCVSRMESLSLSEEGAAIASQREKDAVERVSFRLPAVVSYADFQLKQPTISLMALKRAKSREITVWGSEDIGADASKCGTDGSKTKVLNVKSEWSKKKGVQVGGMPCEKASMLLDIVLRRAAVR